MWQNMKAGRSTRRALLACVLGACVAWPAAAHHSAAMFDQTKLVSFAGTIHDFQWTNPHSWLVLEVPQPDGADTLWSFEAGPPNMLIRFGVSARDLPSGQKVTVRAFPMKDGRRGGLLQSVVRADKSVVVFSRLGPTDKP